MTNPKPDVDEILDKIGYTIAGKKPLSTIEEAKAQLLAYNLSLLPSLDVTSLGQFLNTLKRPEDPRAVVQQAFDAGVLQVVDLWEQRLRKSYK